MFPLRGVRTPESVHRTGCAARGHHTAVPERWEWILTDDAGGFPVSRHTRHPRLSKDDVTPMHVKIYYEDTDCGGVVYYANYLKYFERARTEYLLAHGISVAEFQRQGLYFVVTHAEVFYRSAAYYGETLHIDTAATAARKAGVTFAHTIREADSRRLVVEGSATLVTVDNKGKVKKPIPQLVAMLR